MHKNVYKNLPQAKTYAVEVVLCLCLQIKENYNNNYFQVNKYIKIKIETNSIYKYGKKNNGHDLFL